MSLFPFVVRLWLFQVQVRCVALADLSVAVQPAPVLGFIILGIQVDASRRFTDKFACVGALFLKDFVAVMDTNFPFSKVCIKPRTLCFCLAAGGIRYRWNFLPSFLFAHLFVRALCN